MKRLLRYSRTLAMAVTLTMGALPLVSCLGEPEVDERWTLLEMRAVAPAPGVTVSGNQISVAVDARVTYRQILTGFMVAEVRYSDVFNPANLALDPTVHDEETAEDIDAILANSVTMGRATKAVTGWDHLMQDMELDFTAQVPQMNASDPNQGLFLLVYMGSGEEIQLQDGRDSLVVTPFVSTDKQVLHTGFALDVSP